MASPAGILTRMFGTAISGIAGFAGGTALGPVLSPVVQLLRNDVNSHYPYVPPDAGLLAEGVAQGQVDPDQAALWASMHGIGQPAFDALVNIANVGPGLAQAFNLWRRRQIDEAGFRRALKRLGLEPEWIDALWNVREVPLTPDTIANAVHRGIMRDPSLIVREPPTTAGKVEQIPPSPIDPATEAEWSGIDHERLRVMVGTTGLPPGLVQMLQLLNRGEVTEDDVRRAVAESNLRNEYMDVVLALRRHLLTPHEYAEAELRGIAVPGGYTAGAELSGLEPDDYRILFELLGRPLAVHQITTGLARGATLGGTYDDVPEPYRDAIRRSAIRPEYARLAYANRFTYPGAFVLRALAEAGDLGTAADVEKILLAIGWPPDLAAKVAPKWVGGGTGAGAQVTTEQKRLRTQAHKSYVASEIDAGAARAALTASELDAADIDLILPLWDAERALIRAQLSPADIRKAFQQEDVNAATGAAWTQADALAALEARGYSATEAQSYLNIPYKG